MSNPKSKKPSRRISSSGSDDCGCTASHTMPGEGGELDTLHLMPGSEDFSSNLSAGGMHANDDDQDGRMPGGGMDARDEDADDGMPGGGMGGGGFGGGGFGSGGSGSGGGGRDGDTPQSRSCATMEVHHRLLRDPAYARARDEIENQARFFERRSGAAGRHPNSGGRACGVEHGGAKYFGRADRQPDRCAQSRLPSHQSGRQHYACRVPAVGGGRASRVRSRQCRPERRTDQRHHAPANNRCLVQFGRRGQVSGERRHQRVARGPLSQHLGVPARRRVARLRAIPRRTSRDRRRGHSSFGVRHGGHGCSAVPSRPHRDPRDRPLVEPEPHLGR